MKLTHEQMLRLFVVAIGRSVVCYIYKKASLEEAEGFNDWWHTVSAEGRHLTFVAISWELDGETYYAAALKNDLEEIGVLEAIAA